MEVIKQSSGNVASGSSNSKNAKALESGPLESVFPGSTSKILDFLATFKEWDYSVSDISRNTGLSFKTTLGEIKNLNAQQVIFKTRNVGKSNMYKLNRDSKQGYHIDKLIFELAKKRILEQAGQAEIKEAKTAQAWKRMKVRKEMEA